MDHTVLPEVKKVLVIDDEEAVVRPIDYILRLHHYQPITATQWTDALDILEREHPDLVLMDLEMPTIDGPSMLKFIRQEGYTVPVIIVSASITDQTSGELAPFGVAAFIHKPFKMHHIQKEIERVIGPANGPDVPGVPVCPDTEGSEASPDSVLSREVDPEAGSDATRGFDCASGAVPSGQKVNQKHLPARHSRLLHHRAVVRQVRRRYMIYLGVIAMVCLFLGGILSFTHRYMSSIDLRGVISNVMKDQAVKEGSPPNPEGDAKRD